jgi:hypothetical protein
VSKKLTDLIVSLDMDQVRISRPADFVFLCGGKVNDDPASKRLLSLRDFIYRYLSKKLVAHLVLAESAAELFELSGYRDLMEFEKDIARISAVVALVSETAGSLAELGAFSVIEEIAKVLYVLVREELHGNTKSFIRLGPFLSLENLNGAFDPVGDFDWKLRADGSVIRSTVWASRSDIAKSINERSAGATEKLTPAKVAHQMLLIYWICHILRGARYIEIRWYLQKFGIDLEQSTVKRYVYCLRVAGWLGEKNVGSSYFYPRIDKEILSYAFVAGITDKSHSRRKTDIVSEVSASAHRRPSQVLNLVGVT